MKNLCFNFHVNRFKDPDNSCVQLLVLFRTWRYLHHVPKGDVVNVGIMMNESSRLARLLMLIGERKVVRLSRRMVRRRLMRTKPREGWSRVRGEGDSKRDETGIKQARRENRKKQERERESVSIFPSLIFLRPSCIENRLVAICIIFLFSSNSSPFPQSLHRLIISSCKCTKLLM